MKYLIILIGMICLMGCATNNSITKTVEPTNDITIFYPDGIVVLGNGF